MKGAHNWESTGMLSALAALDALARWSAGMPVYFCVATTVYIHTYIYIDVLPF
jgi:hypothetical protein